MTKQEAIEYGKAQLDIFGGKHAEFIKLALEVLENENKGWILTSERLPKNEERILYITKDGMVHSGIYYNDSALSFEWGKFGNFDKDSDVVGWKPYPKERKEL